MPIPTKYLLSRNIFGNVPAMFLQKERKQPYLIDIQSLPFLISYPDPGSNRDGLPHWCLRPARLPIPPSGHGCCLNNGCKGREKIWIWQIFEELFNDNTLNNAYL